MYSRFIVSLCLFVSCFPAAATTETKAIFSPDGNIQAAIVERISRSTRSIDAMMFSLTAKRIASSLVYAKERGLKVRVIADKAQSRAKYSYVGFLISKGVPVKLLSGKTGKGIMHNTTGIFDGTKVITGSYSWTGDAEYYNYENVILTDENDVVQEYKEEFERLWNHDKK
jgi:phosphatidylserine/phosphatidylglycerophosphate/cardiolipin synthase-like enzyme